MAVDSDDPIALPQAPPPRPAARRAAIEAALRKFDGVEDAPRNPARKPPLRAGWAGIDRRAVGALVTAALIAVVSIPLVLTTVRDNVPPSANPPSATAPSVAPSRGPPVQSDAETPAAGVAKEVPAETVEAPNANQPPEGTDAVAQSVPVVVSKSAEPGSIAAEREFSQAPSAPMGAVPAAPPPPPPPPPPPAPSEQLADEVATGGSIVVTGSRVARSNLESASPVAVVESSGGLLEQLQTAIRANDRGSVIGLVALPLLVNLDGQTVSYRSAREVERDFDEIFTARVKQSILNQRAETLRRRGKMRGTSRVWFGPTSPNGPVRIREVTP